MSKELEERIHTYQQDSEQSLNNERLIRKENVRLKLQIEELENKLRLRKNTCDRCNDKTIVNNYTTNRQHKKATLSEKENLHDISNYSNKNLTEEDRERSAYTREKSD